MKILIADRSKQIRNRVEKLAYGILDNVTIFHTDSNIEAIKYIEENYLDIILLDIDLFDGSGFKTLSKTRTVPMILSKSYLQTIYITISKKLVIN